MAAAERRYDIVLFGATGFTGALTAQYLAGHAPAGLRWALAGRNRDKLTALRERLAAAHPDRPALAELPLLSADVTDPASLREVASSARIVVTTVGPYLTYGGPLVAACAAAGTDYLDLTGEAEFVDRSYVRHNEEAIESGARLIHACGFDSVPYDLGVLYTLRHLPGDVPISVDGFVRAGGRFSAGTYHSALTAISRQREAREAARARRAAEPDPAGRRVRVVAQGPARVPQLGVWRVPLPTVDPQIVRASALLSDRYGPDFRYGHYAAVKRLATVVGAGAGLGALAALAQVGPTRRWLSGRLTSGAGPSEQQREKSWFQVRFLGSAGGRQVLTEVSGGDPGYTETAKMLAESALCLASDELPATAGQVTTAVAMGDALIDRLSAAGIRFRVAEPAA
ncbi:saccharopine dehydrogenase family protein [Micromonosporaceae bacterium DT55]|uniref:saccharopine dehydrogenase family protein n=1 Tax=Melissospora conviva TaxID=3388432 RepID=UPI003C26B6E8